MQLNKNQQTNNTQRYCKNSKPIRISSVSELQGRPKKKINISEYNKLQKQLSAVTKECNKLEKQLQQLDENYLLESYSVMYY